MERHTNCSICRSIPDRSAEFWKEQDLGSGGDIPSSARQLRIVGAPFFNDSTSHSHTILKKCPECATFYEWGFTYEFLTHGSENDIVLTRLSDREGARRETQAYQTIRFAEDKFRDEAEARVEVLLHSQDGRGELGGAYGAAYFFSTNLRSGHDLEFAIPALVKALARFSGREGFGQTVFSLYQVLSEILEQTPVAARGILDLLEAETTESPSEHTRWLISRCHKALEE